MFAAKASSSRKAALFILTLLLAGVVVGALEFRTSGPDSRTGTDADSQSAAAVAQPVTDSPSPDASTQSRPALNSNLVAGPGTGGAVLSRIRGTKHLPLASARVGFVIPSFTLTPYVNFGGSFYAFYVKYKSATGHITGDLGWLSTKVSNDRSPRGLDVEKPLYDFLVSQTARNCGLALGANLRMIDDVSVDDGSLFAAGSRLFDVIILGHEEYVTRSEYNQFKQFVATGGRIVEMSGNTFWGQVNYSRSSGVETFVAGHGFEFNGHYAVRSYREPFDKDSQGWFGSSFAAVTPQIAGAFIINSSRIGLLLEAAFHSNVAFTGYTYPHNEVNYLSNYSHTQVVATCFLGPSHHKVSDSAYPRLPVVAYVHSYVKGEVICLCVFGENLIQRDQDAQFFLVYGVISGYEAVVEQDLHLTLLSNA